MADLCPISGSEGIALCIEKKIEAEVAMIHGLPAENAAAAACAGRLTMQAANADPGRERSPAEDAFRGGAHHASAVPPASVRRVTPAKSLDPEEKAKEDAGASVTAPQEKPDAAGLTEAEQEEIKELKARDREVRNHEQAHIAAGAGYIVRGAQYTYEQAPNGIRYAVGGEVKIDVSPVPGDPAATVKKAEAIRKAALAPARPSAQDRRVAAEAAQMKTEAKAEKLEAEAEEKSREAGPGSRRSLDLYA